MTGRSFEHNSPCILEDMNIIYRRSLWTIIATPAHETAVLAASPGFGKTVFECKLNGQWAENYIDLEKDFIHARYM